MIQTGKQYIYRTQENGKIGLRSHTFFLIPNATFQNKKYIKFGYHHFMKLFINM